LPAEAEWLGVINLAADHDLLPTFWRAGVDRGWFAPLPSPALAAVEARFAPGRTQPALELQRAYDDNAHRLDDLLDQGERLLAALGRDGVAAVPLKGWLSVRERWYPDPAVRVMRDLDVLIPVDRAADASRAAAKLGYEPIEEALDDYADHQLPAMAIPGRLGSLELHTALVVSRWANVLPASDVIAADRMTTTQAVVHAIAHAQLHDEAFLLRHRPLRALHETAVLSRSPRGSEIDWDEARRAFDRVDAAPALDAHLHLARELFGADVPLPRSRWRARLHERLCNLELTTERGARAYRAAVFTPRALGRTRMQKLYGPGNIWRARLRHLRGSARRAFGSSTSP
jgi:hypothetical protein